MYEQGKGYPPSAPVYSPPGVGEALPPPPAYGGGPQPIGFGGGYQYNPSSGFGGPQQPGVGGGYPSSPQYGVGGAQHPGVGGAYPSGPPYGVGGSQPIAVTTPVVPTVIIGATFADTPVRCTCPVCHQSIVTRIEPKSGLMTWLIFGTLIILGCWLGCCLIPFFMDSCKDIDHYCPSCNHLMSKYKRI
ncbi:uncharacterized protein ACNLHF_025196 isoform 2-T2 [Anomaloglossus baeobatrachus]